MKKKVAILADFPWSFFAGGATGRGGGQQATWLTQVAEEYAKSRDFEVHWVSLDRELFFGRTLHREWAGQFFHNIPVWRRKPDIGLGYQPSRLLLKWQLDAIKPDLLHAWGTESPYPMALGWRGVPSILSMQGVLTYLGRMKYLPDTWVWRRMSRMEKDFIRRADLVTCESQWAIDRVREVVPGLKMRMVEYGVHPGFYTVEWQPDLCHPYVFFAGSLTCYKGVDVLLEAVGSIRDRRWNLQIAGDGPLRDAVVSCGIPGVEWVGVLPWVELRERMRKAICLVHPTLADSSPNVVKEARVIGLPVITTPNGGQAGYIRHGENGLVVDPLEPVALAKALEQVMNDPLLASRMGGTHHETDRDYFRPSNTAGSFLELYHELLSV